MKFIYKDREPSETVGLIKLILSKFNICTQEKWIDINNPIPSVVIKCPQFHIFSNGKGINKEYALASGYAEFIERLFNNAYFRYSSLVSYFYVNEFKDDDVLTFVNLHELSKMNNILLKNDDYALSDLCVDDSLRVICEKFVDKQDNQYLFPMEYIDYTYGTNGMASGNSFFEAASQGLLEIIERYVNKKMIQDKLNPRLFSEDEFDSYDDLKTVRNILLANNYCVYNLDLSFNYGYPVCGLLVINKDNNKYFFKLGAHPIRHVALTRCYTELLQGKNIKEYKGMTDFETKCVDFERNMYSIFSNGEGVYPVENFMFHAPLYQAEPIITDNKSLYDWIVNFIENLGYNIVYNHQVINGMDIVHYIIPGMSEIHNTFDSAYLTIKRHAIEIIRGKSSFNDFIDNILFDTKGRNFTNETIGSFYFNSEIACSLCSIQLNLLLSYIMLYKDNYNSAYKYISDHIASYQSEDNIPEYYKCYKSYLYLRINNIHNPWPILKLFYNDELILQIKKGLNKPLSEIKKCFVAFSAEKSIFTSKLDLFKRIHNIV